MPIGRQHEIWSIDMPTRSVVLTDHQADLLERLVASGRYQNVSEVLREGLRLLETRDTEEKVRLKALREARKWVWPTLRLGALRPSIRLATCSATLHRSPTAHSAGKDLAGALGEGRTGSLARAPRGRSRS
jgi:putative addiction module CopG family antidote